MSGRLYGVGVGPGDPELMTLKAVRILAAVSVVAWFCKKGRAGHARTIVEGHLRADAVLLPMVYPVTTEIPFEDEAYAAALTPFYDSCAAMLAAHLDAGRDVAVIAEGDPFFYGSFAPLFHRLSDLYPTETVAGVMGMAGAWARAGLPITYGDDVLAVVPATLSEAALVAQFSRGDAAVVMKLGRNLPKMRRVLERVGALARALYVERVTMSGESVMPLKDRDDGEAPYFSMLLVPGRGRHF